MEAGGQAQGRLGEEGPGSPAAASLPMTREGPPFWQESVASDALAVQGCVRRASWCVWGGGEFSPWRGLLTPGSQHTTPLVSGGGMDSSSGRSSWTPRGLYPVLRNLLEIAILAIYQRPPLHEALSCLGARCPHPTDRQVPPFFTSP